MFKPIIDWFKKYLPFIGMGIVAVFGVVFAIASLVFNAKKGLEELKPKPTDPPVKKEELDIKFNNKTGKDSPAHTSDEDTRNTLSKLLPVVIGFFLLASVETGHAGTNSLQTQYDGVYKKLDSDVITAKEKNNLATRYTVISSYNPSYIEYPSFKVIIYNNNTYQITNISNTMTVYYDYGAGKNDKYVYTLDPQVSVTFTNTNVALDLKKHVYIGFSFGYTTNNTLINHCLIGYTAFSWMGLSLVPCLGFSLPDRVDIIPNITYNLFDYCDIGLGVTLIRFGVVLTIGKNF